MKNIFRVLFVFLVLIQVSDAKLRITKELLLGNVIKSRLEEMHFERKKLNDQISKNAFKEYLNAIDSGKQYFIKSEVSDLKKYEFKIDDELVSGNFELLTASKKLLKTRMEEIRVWVNEILEKPFDFNQKEVLESDPKKREFASNTKELKELWRKQLKQSALNKVIDLLETQEGTKKNELAKVENSTEETEHDGVKATLPTGPYSEKKTEKAEPAKVEKKKTLAELEKEARDSVKKSYESIFSRLTKQDDEFYLEQYLNSVTTVYDPHTNYFSPDKKEDFDIDMKGSLEGIGAVLQEDGSYIKVVKIVPGSASWTQGDLQVEDKIIKVGQGDEEPADIFDMRLRDVVNLIRGQKGSTVKLTVKKSDGRITIIPIKRDVVKIEESFAKGRLIEEKNLGIKVGYIYLPKFYRDFNAQGIEARNCTDDVNAEVQKFNKQNVDGIILDLRNNGGGALEDAIKMSGLFIDEGPIVQVKQSDGQVRVSNDEDKGISYKGPLIILTNQFSASASEILAAALQDYNRAVILGSEHTHGKGTVQTIFELDKGLSSQVDDLKPLGALKVTIQKFYRVNGGSTQYKGVTPHLIVPDTYGFIESGEKHIDYSLPWDELKPLIYKKWTAYEVDTKTLAKKSQERIKKDSHFKSIDEKNKYMKIRRDETKISLNLKIIQEQRAKDEKTLEKFKNNDLNDNLIVYDEKGQKVKFLTKEELEKKNKENENAKNKNARKDENPEIDWLRGINVDPVVEESLHVMKDIITMIPSDKLVGLKDKK